MLGLRIIGLCIKVSPSPAMILIRLVLGLASLLLMRLLPVYLSPFGRATDDVGVAVPDLRLIEPWTALASNLQVGCVRYVPLSWSLSGSHSGVKWGLKG